MKPSRRRWATCVDVGVAFVVDALAAGVAAGGLAPRHGQASGVLGRWAAAGDGLCGGCAQFGEQQSAAGMCGDGVAVGVDPDDSAVGVLPIGPAGPERLHQMMLTAQTSQVGRRRRPPRIRHRVIDVGDGGRLHPAGEPTGLVAASDEFRQRLRRSVPGFGWGVAGVGQGADGGVHRGLGYHWGGDHRAAEDDAGSGGAEFTALGVQCGGQCWPVVGVRRLG